MMSPIDVRLIDGMDKETRGNFLLIFSSAFFGWQVRSCVYINTCFLSHCQFIIQPVDGIFYFYWSNKSGRLTVAFFPCRSSSVSCDSQDHNFLVNEVCKVGFSRLCQQYRNSLFNLIFNFDLFYSCEQFGTSKYFTNLIQKISGKSVIELQKDLSYCFIKLGIFTVFSDGHMYLVRVPYI